MRTLTALLFALLLCVATSCDSTPENLGYDPSANAIDQWHKALAEARASRKRVLVIAGGDWCRYCHELGSFLKDNADVDTALHQAFVVLKVYYGDDNYNEAFFAKLSPGQGYPHFWVLDGDGGAIFSCSITEVESADNSINREYFLSFIQQYGGAKTPGRGE